MVAGRDWEAFTETVRLSVPSGSYVVTINGQVSRNSALCQVSGGGVSPGQQFVNAAADGNASFSLTSVLTVSQPTGEIVLSCFGFGPAEVLSTSVTALPIGSIERSSGI